MAEIVSVKRTGEVVFDKRGNVLCDHGKRERRCRECNGSDFCEHGKQKFYCKLCGGKAFCEHGKQKIYCRECGGSLACLHNKRRDRCRECNGTSICEHNKLKYSCKDCGGAQICEHGRIKYRCRDCGGSYFCKHDKQKDVCKECGGSKLCKSPWCESIKQKKYNDYCLRCCVNLHPEIKISRNYKTKETDVVSRITESFPNFTWVADKKVLDGCSQRRPDLLLDLGSHIVIVEVDENRHTDYDCSCEHKRLMQLSQDVGHRPIVFIRFNPDDYIDTNGKKVTSCWRVDNRTGILHVPVSKTEEWSKRIEILKETINYWVSNPTEKTVEIIELFY